MMNDMRHTNDAESTVAPTPSFFAAAKKKFAETLAAHHLSSGSIRFFGYVAARRERAESVRSQSLRVMSQCHSHSCHTVTTDHHSPGVGSLGNPTTGSHPLGRCPACVASLLLGQPQTNPHTLTETSQQLTASSRDFARNADFAPLLFEMCRGEPVRLRTSCILLPELRNIQATCSLLSVLE